MNDGLLEVLLSGSLCASSKTSCESKLYYFGNRRRYRMYTFVTNSAFHHTKAISASGISRSSKAHPWMLDKPICDPEQKMQLHNRIAQRACVLNLSSHNFTVILAGQRDSQRYQSSQIILPVEKPKCVSTLATRTSWKLDPINDAVNLLNSIFTDLQTLRAYGYLFLRNELRTPTKPTPLSLIFSGRRHICWSLALYQCVS